LIREGSDGSVNKLSFAVEMMRALQARSTIRQFELGHEISNAQSRGELSKRVESSLGSLRIKIR
jgi:hypothetical protein